jgi:alkylated DNA nucleotide flippase Atl1
VVAQALAYAAYLNELDARTFEDEVIAPHLRGRGFESLEMALIDSDQSGAYDPSVFREGLEAAFSEGAFRLVFVLDEAPAELVRLVGYLESISERLVIDLVSVAAYEVGDSKILVPQRVEPERRARDAAPQSRVKAVAGNSTRGTADFVAGVERSPLDQRATLKKLADWAERLEADRLARISTYNGQGRQTLLPTLPQDGVGLVTLWNEKGASIQFWRSVFERRAPVALLRLEELIAPIEVRQGNSTRDVTDDLLDVLRAAYLEAGERARAGFDWSKVRAAIEAVPPGSWTTYGDLAELAGTAAMPVGQFVTRERIEGAWRVMGVDGRPRPDFRWLDPDDTRDVVEVLRSEGVSFSANGAADAAQRLKVSDLAGLIGDE